MKKIRLFNEYFRGSVDSDIEGKVAAFIEREADKRGEDVEVYIHTSIEELSEALEKEDCLVGNLGGWQKIADSGNSKLLDAIGDLGEKGIIYACEPDTLDKKLEKEYLSPNKVISTTENSKWDLLVGIFGY